MIQDHIIIINEFFKLLIYSYQFLNNNGLISNLISLLMHCRGFIYLNYLILVFYGLILLYGFNRDEIVRYCLFVRCCL